MKLTSNAFIDLILIYWLYWLVIHQIINIFLTSKVISVNGHELTVHSCFFVAIYGSRNFNIHGTFPMYKNVIYSEQKGSFDY